MNDKLSSPVSVIFIIYVASEFQNETQVVNIHVSHYASQSSLSNFETEKRTLVRIFLMVKHGKAFTTAQPHNHTI